MSGSNVDSFDEVKVKTAIKDALDRFLWAPIGAVDEYLISVSRNDRPEDARMEEDYKVAAIIAASRAVQLYVHLDETEKSHWVFSPEAYSPHYIFECKDFASDDFFHITLENLNLFRTDRPSCGILPAGGLDDFHGVNTGAFFVYSMDRLTGFACIRRADDCIFEAIESLSMGSLSDGGVPSAAVVDFMAALSRSSTEETLD